MHDVERREGLREFTGAGRSLYACPM